MIELHQLGHLDLSSTKNFQLFVWILKKHIFCPTVVFLLLENFAAQLGKKIAKVQKKLETMPFLVPWLNCHLWIPALKGSICIGKYIVILSLVLKTSLDNNEKFKSFVRENMIEGLNIQRTFYSATSFLEKCRKVVLEKWFLKLGFFCLVNHFSPTWKNMDL